MDYKALMQKRVAGIPVVYLAAAAALIFAIVAWRMKPKADVPVSGDEGNDGASGSGDGLAEGGTVTTADFDGTVYDGLKTTGTVVVAPVPPDKTATPDAPGNDDWVREGAQWLIDQNKASGTEAATALSKYINGQDRSYNENALVDAWIGKKGLPPNMPDSTGNVGAKPVVKSPTAPTTQGKPPLIHKVKGNADNTLAKLAGMYYGRTDPGTIDLLQANNPNVRGNDGPYMPGQNIRIVVWHPPKYYTTPTAMTTHQIAARNGLAAWSIEVLNNTKKENWPKGAKVRVA